MEHNPESSLEQLMEDYATVPVPEHISASGWRISMVNTALAFSLPGLATGMAIGPKIGLYPAIVVFLIGGLLLSVIGYITGIMGVRNRLSSYMLIKRCFGEFGSRVINLSIAASMFGWFGVNVLLFGDAGGESLTRLGNVDIPDWQLICLGGGLMTLAAVFGFKSIQRLSALVVPLQLLVFATLLYQLLSHANAEQLLATTGQGELSYGDAISAVVGSFIVSAVVMPDLTRYGKTHSDAMVASLIPFFLASTVVYVCSAAAALWMMENNVLQLLLSAGLGSLAFVFILFSSLITNAMNLYGCSLSVAAVTDRLKEWQVVCISGAVGTIASLTGVFDNIIDFIFSLGILFTPIAGIYITDYFLVHGGSYTESDKARSVSWPAMTAWVMGVLIAYAAEAELLTLTSIAAIDSLLAAMLIYCAVMLMFNPQLLQLWRSKLYQ